MERNVLGQLIAWKDSEGRKPLLLSGVRQCGKTYILKEFGSECFEDAAYFNFEGDDGLCSVFDHDFDVAQRRQFESGSNWRR